MDVCVIGRGSSSIITTLKLLQRGHKVTVHYDPNIPHIIVGESTTPQLADLIEDVTGITVSHLVDDELASFKLGVHFIGWGPRDNYKYPFINQSAMHFMTDKFNDAFWSYLQIKFGVNLIGERVDSYHVENDKVMINGNQYDFLVRCSGFPSNNLKPTRFETVNSVVVFNKPEIEDPLFTLHRATEDGWQFELPFPNQNVSHCGYLYNNKYISKKEVEKKINYPILGSFSWKPQFSPFLLESAFVAVNGNSALFFEPLQALSLHYYVDFAEYICNFLDNRSEQNYYYTNNLYRNEVYSYEYTIAFHYNAGSKYKSKFWKNTKRSAEEIFSKSPNGDINFVVDNIVCDSKYQTQYSRIGCFTSKDTKLLVSGLYDYTFV